MIGWLLVSLKKSPRLLGAIAISWVFLVAAIAFLWHLGSVGLIDETEPKFVEAARQMAITGDWITPYFNDATRFDKPPLIYWLMAIGFKTIGVNTWAARLPSALSAMVLVGLMFYTLQNFAQNLGSFPQLLHKSPTQSHADQLEKTDTIRRQLQPWLSATIASTILALTPQIIAWARTGVSDMLLTASIGAAMLSFFCAYAHKDRPKPQTLWYFAFYVFLALGTLDKGPVAIVLPGLAIIPFLLYVGNLRSVLRESRLIPGTLLYLLITVPWFAAVTWVHGKAYTDTFFGHHNFERFTNVVDNHAAPWYFYFVIVLAAFLPFSIYLPLAIARLKFWRRRFWQQQSRSQQLGLFAWFWFASVFIFFSISVTKLPSYVLPLMPAAAILVGLLWSEIMIQPIAKQVYQLNMDRDLGLHSGSNLASQSALESGQSAQSLASLKLERSPDTTDITANQATGITTDGATASVQNELESADLNQPTNQPETRSLSNSTNSVNQLGLVISAIVNVMILFVLAWAGWQVTNLIGQDSAAPDLQQVLQSSGAPTLSGIIWLVAAIAGVVILITRKWQHLPIVNIMASLAFTIVLVGIALFVLDNQRQLPLRQLSAQVISLSKPQEELVMLGLTKGSVNFYSDRRHVYFVEEPPEIDAVISEIAAKSNPAANKQSSSESSPIPNAAINSEPNRHNLPQPDTFLLLTNDSELGLSGLAIEQVEHQELATAGVYRLIRLPVTIETNRKTTKPSPEAN
jgi:4-amino-4-deoxy-L-arabinose transferase-like glycosyltransferase